MKRQTIAAVLALIIAGAVGAQVVTTIQNTDFEQQRAEERAYCDQIIGPDASLWVGGSTGKHAGYHCSKGPYKFHLALVPDEYKQQAYNASQAGQDLGWGPKTFNEHKNPNRVGPSLPEQLAGVIVLTLIVAFVLGLIKRYNDWQSRHGGGAG